jgi:hypothetical protein
VYRRVAPFSVKSIRLLVTSLEKTNVPSSGKPKGKRGQEKENVPPGPPKRKKTKADKPAGKIIRVKLPPAQSKVHPK